MNDAIEIKIPANATVSAHPRLKAYRIKIARLTGWEILWAVLKASGLTIAFVQDYSVKVYENYIEIAYGQPLSISGALA